MNMLNLNTKLLSPLLCLLLFLSVFSTTLAAQCVLRPQPTPRNLNTFLTLESTFDLNGAQAATDPAFFHTTVLSRTPAQIAATRSAAENYFLSEFGLTVNTDNTVTSSDGRYAGRFYETMLNPGAGLRVIAAGNEYVPPTGWTAYSRRHWISLDSPRGVYLTGNYTGPSNGYVPKNTSVAYGELHIEEANDCGDTSISRTYTYRSAQPIIPDFQQRGIILYDFIDIAGNSQARSFSRSEVVNDQVVVRWIIKGRA